MEEILEDLQRGDGNVMARCRCGFEVRDNDLERFDSLCPECGLDWWVRGFDGLKNMVWLRVLTADKRMPSEDAARASIERGG